MCIVKNSTKRETHTCAYYKRANLMCVCVCVWLLFCKIKQTKVRAIYIQESELDQTYLRMRVCKYRALGHEQCEYSRLSNPFMALCSDLIPSCVSYLPLQRKCSTSFKYAGFKSSQHQADPLLNARNANTRGRMYTGLFAPTYFINVLFRR